MTTRWTLALPLLALLIAPIARAESIMPAATQSHVEALCHSWTESPCLLRVGGHLRSQETGRPLVGKRLRFVSAGDVICSATTDSLGRASCLGIVRSGRTVAERGYRILFDGEGPFLANSAEGF